MDSRSNLETKTVVQLKEILKSRGLPVSGRKADLIARIVASSDDGQGISNLTDRKVDLIDRLKNEVDKIIPFYGQTGKYSPLSNWYYSKFVDNDRNTFYASEQYDVRESQTFW